MAKCPVCGKTEVGLFEYCEVCRFPYHPYAVEEADNWVMDCSLNIAKKLYAKYGKEWRDHIKEEE